MSESEDERPAEVRTPSKTRRKQAAHDLQALGGRLVELPRERLNALDLPEELRAAIVAAQSMGPSEARRRQLQYIGKLMRGIDPADIQARLAVWDGSSAAEVALQHALERWRTRLMDDDSALTELATAYPGCDTQHLRTLMRSARREYAEKRPPRSYRELFRALRAIVTTAAAHDD
jgi:ribosome-associated protein